MRRNAKDDPNFQFAAPVFGFIFSPGDISIFQSKLCSDFHGINVGLLAHPWTPFQKIFF